MPRPATTQPPTAQRCERDRVRQHKLVQRPIRHHLISVLSSNPHFNTPQTPPAYPLDHPAAPHTAQKTLCPNPSIRSPNLSLNPSGGVHLRTMTRAADPPRLACIGLFMRLSARGCGGLAGGAEYGSWHLRIQGHPPDSTRVGSPRDPLDPIAAPRHRCSVNSGSIACVFCRGAGWPNSSYPVGLGPETAPERVRSETQPSHLLKAHTVQSAPNAPVHGASDLAGSR